METAQRRTEILHLLYDSAEPITGTELAHQFNVSRQVIVQDIALLRAAGEQVLATPQGYLLPRSETRALVQAVIACSHTRTQMGDELGIVVDLGGKVRDVVVEHPIYGEMRANLMIASRRDLSLFLRQVEETQAQPLSALTDGLHLHTVEAPSTTIMQEIRDALDNAGFLVC
ncbi:MAG: transcription repressor NadR [Firmicutes bacterium]|nr:transcription repressor NadR [Bacillota bacterium]